MGKRAARILQRNMNIAGLSVRQPMTETELAKVQFVKELKLHGIVSRAVVASGVSRATIYRWRTDDDTFRELWDDAHAYAIGEYEGVVHNVAHAGEYDRDRLAAATFMLRHQDPRFKEAKDGAKQQLNVIVKVPAAAQLSQLATADANDREFQALSATVMGQPGPGPKRSPDSGGDSGSPGPAVLPEFLQSPFGPTQPLLTWLDGDNPDRDDGPRYKVVGEQQPEPDWASLIPEGLWKDKLDE